MFNRAQMIPFLREWAWLRETSRSEKEREVCHALGLDEFSTRMGVEREEAARLLEQVHALVTGMEWM